MYFIPKSSPIVLEEEYYVYQDIRNLESVFLDADFLKAINDGMFAEDIPRSKSVLCTYYGCVSFYYNQIGSYSIQLDNGIKLYMTLLSTGQFFLYIACSSNPVHIFEDMKDFSDFKIIGRGEIEMPGKINFLLFLPQVRIFIKKIERFSFSPKKINPHYYPDEPQTASFWALYEPYHFGKEYDINFEQTELFGET